MLENTFIFTQLYNFSNAYFSKILVMLLVKFSIAFADKRTYFNLLSCGFPHNLLVIFDHSRKQKEHTFC